MNMNIHITKFSLFIITSISFVSICSYLQNKSKNNLHNEFIKINKSLENTEKTIYNTDKQSDKQSEKQSEEQSIKQSEEQSIKQSIKQTEEQSIKQSIKQTEEQSIKQSIKQSEEQSEEQSIGYLRLITKKKEEVEFEKENPDEIIIKIITDEKICIDTEQLVFNIISETTNKNINLILNVCGANINVVLRICHCLYTYKKLNPENKIKIYVIKYAYSAGTYISLMADELYLNDYALLSPVDTQLSSHIDSYSANDYIEFSENENTKNTSILNNILLMSIVARKNNNMCKDIFKKYVFNNNKKYTVKQRNTIMTKFLHTEKPHISIIDKEDVENLGIQITGNVPEKIMQIYKETMDDNCIE